MQTDYDIAIVGGGMVGASLACALAGSTWRVALIEAVAYGSDAQPSYDDRGLSLSLATQRILAALNLWPAVAASATPVEHIHVSDRGHFGFVRLHASELELPALGYVVVARELGAALMAGLEAIENVDFLCPARVEDVAVNTDAVTLKLDAEAPVPSLSCRLMIVADGTRSVLRERLGFTVREKDYGQTAIVANASPQHHHNNWAWERFTESGPVALLPLPDHRCASVLTVSTEETETCMNMSDDEYLELLQTRFGRRLGRFLRVGRRRSYPVVKLEPDSPLQHRALLLGNAAHTIHPNAAQGFNLGLRDAAGLAETLQQAGGRDPGDPDRLADYLALRRDDQQRVIGFTDRLATLFCNEQPALILARDAGMLLTDMIPGLKQAFMRRAMGISGRQPAMVRTGKRPGH